MNETVKRRVIGAAVLIAAGVLIPVTLVKLAQPSAPPRGESVRVYEITPTGETRPVEEGVSITRPRNDDGAQTGKRQAQQKAPQKTNQVPEPLATGDSPAPVESRPAPSAKAEAAEKRSSASRAAAQDDSSAKPERVAQRDAEADEQAAKPQPAPAKSAPATKKPEPTPKPAVKAETPPAEVKPGEEYWVVQVGSFGDESNAIGLMQKLRRNFPVFYREGELNGKRLYRVRVGPFNSRETAQVEQTRLQKEGYKTQVLSLP